MAGDKKKMSMAEMKGYATRKLVAGMPPEAVVKKLVEQGVGQDLAERIVRTQATPMIATPVGSGFLGLALFLIGLSNQQPTRKLAMGLIIAGIVLALVGVIPVAGTLAGVLDPRGFVLGGFLAAVGVYIDIRGIVMLQKVGP